MKKQTTTNKSNLTRVTSSALGRLIKSAITVALFAALLLLLPLRSTVLAIGQPQVSVQVITTVDYPGSISTFVHGIDNRGDCAGYYFDTSNVIRGFVRLANGTLSAPVVDPNDTGNVTGLAGINSSRVACGSYSDSSMVHGFFFSKGNYTTFDVPGAALTEVIDLNDAGDFVGITSFTGFMGFINVTGATTLFRVPGSGVTDTHGLNATDESVGTYDDSALVLPWLPPCC